MRLCLQVGMPSLCIMDATCSAMRIMIRTIEAFRIYGENDFHGIILHDSVRFPCQVVQKDKHDAGKGTLSIMNHSQAGDQNNQWKLTYMLFKQALSRFPPPWDSIPTPMRLTENSQIDLEMRLTKKILDDATKEISVEIHVEKNPDVCLFFIQEPLRPGGRHSDVKNI